MLDSSVSLNTKSIAGLEAWARQIGFEAVKLGVVSADTGKKMELLARELERRSDDAKKHNLRIWVNQAGLSHIYADRIGKRIKDVLLTASKKFKILYDGGITSDKKTGVHIIGRSKDDLIPIEKMLQDLGLGEHIETHENPTVETLTIRIELIDFVVRQY